MTHKLHFKRNKHLQSYKILYRNVYNSFVHNHPKPENNQDVFALMTEEILLYVYVIGYYSAVKTVDRCHNIDDSNE